MNIYNHRNASDQSFRSPEDYTDVKSLTMPGRSQSVSDLIARSVNGASSNYFRTVEYDGDHVDVDRVDMIDDPDFSYCDVGSATEQYKEMQKRLHDNSIDLTKRDDDDDDDANE